MAELKPCPFCGGEAGSVKVVGLGVAYVECKVCGAMVGRTRKIISTRCGNLHYTTREEAIEAWNRRAGDG